MAGMLYGAWNLVGKGPGTLASSSAHSLLGLAGLYDGQAAKPFVFNAAAADDYVKKDVNATTNNGFETSTLSGWTSANLGTGTSTETTTAGEFRTGAKACKMTGTDASNYGARYQDFEAEPGSYWKLDCYARGIGSGTAKVYIQNRNNGKYFNGSAWGASKTAAASTSATSFTNLTATLQVESFADSNDVGPVTLRLTLACESGTVSFDDVLFLPGVNGCMVSGHNLGPITPLLQSSDDDSSYTTRITMAVRQPAFYGYDSATMHYRRYWKLLLQGTNLSAGYLGEWWLGQFTSPDLRQQMRWNGRWVYAQVRQTSMGGEVWRYLMSAQPSRVYAFSFRGAPSGTERPIATLRDALFRVTQGGAQPLVFVPYDAEAECVFGLVDDSLDLGREMLNVVGAGLQIVELPTPLVGL